MSASVIPFPQRSPFVVRVEREGPAWLVVCRDHGWLHGDRSAAIADANTIARVRRRREPLSTFQCEFAQANTAAHEGSCAIAIPAPNLA